MRISLGSVSYDFAAGAAARGAGLLRIGREATRGREAGVATQKMQKHSFSLIINTLHQRTLQNFAELCSKSE